MLTLIFDYPQLYHKPKFLCFLGLMLPLVSAQVNDTSTGSVQVTEMPEFGSYKVDFRILISLLV